MSFESAFSRIKEQIDVMETERFSGVQFVEKCKICNSDRVSDLGTFITGAGLSTKIYYSRSFGSSDRDSIFKGLFVLCSDCEKKFIYERTHGIYAIFRQKQAYEFLDFVQTTTELEIDPHQEAQNRDEEWGFLQQGPSANIQKSWLAMIHQLSEFEGQ